MTPFFVQIRCELGKSYQVANALAEAKIASEIYSTAGDYDLLVRFYLDCRHRHRPFCNERVHAFPASRTRVHHHLQGVQGLSGLLRSKCYA